MPLCSPHFLWAKSKNIASTSLNGKSILASSSKVWKSFEIMSASPLSEFAAKSKMLCQISMAKSAFLLVFSRMNSSPKYRGPVCKFLRIKLFEL